MSDGCVGWDRCAAPAVCAREGTAGRAEQRQPWGSGILSALSCCLASLNSEQVLSILGVSPSTHLCSPSSARLGVRPSEPRLSRTC